MALKEYRRKRDFRASPEPKGKRPPKQGWSFVVQKHDASRLHYDFRLELDGVLLSWAVPKGPSLDPAVKRLAVHVEDHPVEYGGFEGSIPAGEYGGGTVMLWDRGTWEPEKDACADYERGRLHFVLHGQRLHGGWVLARTSGASSDGGRNWLLIKRRDKYASTADVTEKYMRSVTTDRTMDEIAAGKRKAKTKPAARKKSSHAAKPKRNRSPGNALAQMPTYIEPQLATLIDRAPDGDEWVNEIKYDGYRMIAYLADGEVKMISRNRNDWSDRMSSLLPHIARLPAEQAILDGEVVVLDDRGLSHFQLLQNAFKEGNDRELQYVVFDLLYFDGEDLRSQPLEARKNRLSPLLKNKTGGALSYSDHVVGRGAEFFDEARRAGLEGIISKRRDRPYQSGRGLDWLKAKCKQEQEVVIGGFTAPRGNRNALGALLVGVRDPKRGLVYAGRVGTGFSVQTLHDLRKRFAPLERDRSPFADLNERHPDGRGAQWIEPRLVAQVEFSNWTEDNRMRHPSYQGLREDKPAKSVTREKPVKLSYAKKTSAANAKKPQPVRNDVTQVAGVRMTNPTKILYPKTGVTKLDLANYYLAVAEWMLPHVAHRPLSIVRCPHGEGQACFFQKHPDAGTPKNLKRVSIQEKSKRATYVVAESADDLVALVQIGALEIHAWGSQTDKIEYPDRLIFDLDPDPSVPWKQVIAAAGQVRDFLIELGLQSFVKTTGGKGLHLVAPIQRRHAWPEAKAFCRAVALAIVEADPRRYTANMSKSVRAGKIFIDYLRNERGATAIVPYSSRAKPQAPVSVPVAWDELDSKITSDYFGLTDVVDRLAKLNQDPWREMAGVRQTLSRSAHKLLGL